MNPIYEKLFDTYGDATLRDLGVCDEDAILANLAELPLDSRTRCRVCTLMLDYYHQWSADAFALGLHLGLSLVHDDVRRGGPQQVQ